MGGRTKADARPATDHDAAAEAPLTADPRPRNRPLLIGAIVVYVACLGTLAAIGIWGP